MIAGDFFVNKAAAKAVVLHPELGEIEIWDTHMHAAGEDGPQTRQAHRMAQAWQLATEVRRGAACGRYVFCVSVMLQGLRRKLTVQMGDFNSQPFSVPIALMRTYGGLRDSYLETHLQANDAPPMNISASNAIASLGMTCDSSINTYSAGKNIPPIIQAQGGKRLDYIFFREGRGSTHRVRCTSSDVVLTGLVPGQSFSYSDHFGLTSTFKFEPASGGSTASTGGAGETSAASAPSSQARLLPLDDESASGPPSPTSAYELHRVPSSDSTASAIRHSLASIRDYYHLAGKRTLRFEQYMVLCIVGMVALAVGSAWQPKSWIQPIFTLVAFALGAAGATFLYTGWLWGRWEKGILDETMADMELQLRALQHGS